MKLSERFKKFIGIQSPAKMRQVQMGDFHFSSFKLKEAIIPADERREIQMAKHEKNMRKVKEIKPISPADVKASEDRLENDRKSEEIDRLILDIKPKPDVPNPPDVLVVNKELPKILSNLIRKLEENSKEQRNTGDFLFKIHVKNSALAVEKNKIAKRLQEQLSAQLIKYRTLPENSYEQQVFLYQLEQQALHLLAKADLVNIKAQELFRRTLLGRYVDDIGSLDGIITDAITEITSFRTERKLNLNF